MGTELAAPSGFNALSPRQQEAHRLKIGVRAEAILGQFWRDDDTPDAVRAVELEGWMDVLENCSHSEIRKAWANYQRSGPRTQSGKLYKPDAGALYRLIINDRPKPRLVRPENAQNANQGQALQAAQMQNGITGQEFSRLMALSNAQQGLGGSYQRAYSGNLANMMSAATGGASRSTTQSQSPGLMGVLGAGLQIASLFSDRRLKTDVRRVGSLDDGTPIYTYRYASGGPVHMGVMADEVERSHPAAVSTGADGLKRVNYGAI